MSFGQLGSLGAGFGRMGGGVGGSSGGSALSTPILAMDPAWVTTDNTPDFIIDIDNTAAAGDSVRLQIQLSGGAWSSLVSDTSHVITAPEDAANSISLALSGLANASYEARCNVTVGASTSAWSNTVSYTIAAATYQGPGDVLASAYAWYSPARAYSAAFAALAGPVMDLVDQAGAHPITINILSTGFVNVSAITAWVAANSVTTICVAQLYDQTGNGRHVVQATLASMPTLTLSSSPTGTLPVVTSAGTQLLATTATYNQAQPLVGSCVYIRTTGTATGGTLGGNTGIVLVGVAGAANLAQVASGAGINKAATDGVWHAVNTLANGASSAINVDNTVEVTGTCGTPGLVANNIRLCRAAGAELLGNIAEAGIWATTTNSTDRGNMNANQHGVNGYNF